MAPLDSSSTKLPIARPAADKRLIVQAPERDALLTGFGKATLDDRYLLPGESSQDLFARVAAAFADDQALAQRLYDYISRLCVWRLAGPGMNA